MLALLGVRCTLRIALIREEFAHEGLKVGCTQDGSNKSDSSHCCSADKARLGWPGLTIWLREPERCNWVGLYQPAQLLHLLAIEAKLGDHLAVHGHVLLQSDIGKFNQPNPFDMHHCHGRQLLLVSRYNQ